MHKIIISFILILIIALLFSGCWNRRELNTLGILGAIAVDMQNDQIVTTFEVIRPATPDNNNGNEPTIVIQSKGSSIFDSVRNATLKFDRKLFWPHIKVNIFSKEFAKQGLNSYLDFYMRDHEPRILPYMLIAKGQDISEILTIKAGSETHPSSYITKTMEISQSATGKSVAVKFHEYLSNSYSEGKQPVIGVVRIQKKGKGDLHETNDNTKNVTKDNKYELSFEGCAVFLNGKLVGFLNGLETRAFNLVSDNIESGIVVASLPNNDGYTSFEIINASSKNNVTINNKNLQIEINVDMEGMLGEVTGNVDLNEINTINRIEKYTSKTIENEIKKTIRKVQQNFKSDIFGFGQAISKSSPEKWEDLKDNWDEIFANIKLNIKVKVETTITRTGLSNIPISRKE